MHESVRVRVLCAVILCWFTGCSDAVGDGQGEARVSTATQQRLKIAPDGDCTAFTEDGVDYWFCPEARSWTGARDFCTGVGFRLAAVESETENQALAAHLTGEVWIGGSDRASEGDWRWSDGTPFWSGSAWGSSVSGAFEAWNDWEPNNQFNEDCSARLESGRWNDKPCGDALAYLCEGDFEDPTSLSQPDVDCTEHVHEGQSYWFCDNARSWDDARERCMAAGLDLASIEDAAGNDFVRSHIDGDSYIGIADREEEGVWRWVASEETTWCGEQDGRAWGDLAYTNWGEDHPVDRSNCRHAEYDGRDYWFCSALSTWDEAREACHSAGMELVAVNDAAEAQFLRDELAFPTWSGGSDAEQEGTWTWPDGSVFWSGGAATSGVYTDWAWTEPNDVGTEHCMQLNLGGQWYDLGCAIPSDFACEGTLKEGAFAQTPDVNDCAVVDRFSGQWRSEPCQKSHPYVCSAAPDNVDAVRGRLGGLATMDRTFRDGWPAVAEARLHQPYTGPSIFRTMESDLGLRACIDELVPVGAPEPRQDGTQIQNYDQRVGGVPVAGRGYTVVTDPAGGAWLSFHGEVAHGVAMPADPGISESAAVDAIVAAVPNITRSDVLAHSSPQLGMVPRWRNGVGRYWLQAWRTWFVDNEPIPATNAIAIDAADGSVLHHTTDTFNACQDVPNADVDATADEDTVFLNDDTPGIYEYDTQSDPVSAVLQPAKAGSGYTHTLSRSSWSPTGSQTEQLNLVARCGAQQADRIAAISVDPTSEELTLDPTQETDVLAALMRSSQTCLDFLIGHIHKPDQAGVPWLPPRGSGGTITLRLGSAVDNTTGWHHRSSALAIDPFEPAHFRAPPDLVCHELMHSITTSRFLDNRETIQGESAVLNEGLSDIAGIAIEASIGRPEETLWCFRNDDNVHTPSSNTCLRNHADPANSYKSLTQPQSFSSPLGGQVSGMPQTYYGDADSFPLHSRWCPWERICSSTVRTECCWPHHNSTVISHWFYMIAHGTDQEPREDGCVFTVPPLNSLDLELSIDEAWRLIARTYELGDETTLTTVKSFANATVRAARDLWGEQSQEMLSVKSAWTAAGVNESSVASAFVLPRPGGGPVHPWPTFQWPTNNISGDWVFQLSIGNTPNWSAPDVETTVTTSSSPVGRVDVALPEGMTDKVHWRVRPVSGQNASWDCAAVYDFEGTGHLEEAGPLEFRRACEGVADCDSNPKHAPDPEGRPFAGWFAYSWAGLEGADHYDVFLNKSPSCEPTASDDVQSVHVHGTRPEATAIDLDPEETYYAHIITEGPSNSVAGATTSFCTTLPIETAPLRAPDQVIAREPYYPDDFTFYIYSYDHPDAFTLNLYEKENDLGAQEGSCTDHRVESVTQDVTSENCAPGSPIDACQGNDFSITIEGLDDPKGYCVEAIAIKAGKESPPSWMGDVIYYLDGPTNVSPGIPHQEAVTRRFTGAAPTPGMVIPDHDCRDPVPFSWQPRPGQRGILGYSLRLASWPTEPLISDTYFLEEYFQKVEDAVRNDPDAIRYDSATDPDLAASYGVIPATGYTPDHAQTKLGRRCYEVFPIVEDPDDPGVPAEYQPRRGESTIQCYTTGPCEPEVWPQEDRRTEPFSDDPIRGTVRLDYVPDQQLEFIFEELATGGTREASNRVSVQATRCEPTEFLYSDLYACELEFEVYPVPGTHYYVGARGWNSDDNPLPDTSGDPDMEKTERITGGICGEFMTPCCHSGKLCYSHAGRSRQYCSETQRVNGYHSCRDMYDLAVANVNIDDSGVGNRCDNNFSVTIENRDYSNDGESYAGTAPPEEWWLVFTDLDGREFTWAPSPREAITGGARKVYHFPDNFISEGLHRVSVASRGGDINRSNDSRLANIDYCAEADMEDEEPTNPSGGFTSIDYAHTDGDGCGRNTAVRTTNIGTGKATNVRVDLVWVDSDEVGPFPQGWHRTIVPCPDLEPGEGCLSVFEHPSFAESSEVTYRVGTWSDQSELNVFTMHPQTCKNGVHEPGWGTLGEILFWPGD